MIKKLDEKYLEKLNNFLNEIDNDFPIPLSEKVNLFEFSKKVLSLGIVLAEFDGDTICGAILFYANDKETKTSYVSVLGVLKSHRKKGIAKRLLSECIKTLKEMDFKTVSLYTHKTNFSAIALYEKNGFKKETDLKRPDDWLLKLKI
ncbi:MAG: GNAT family N-acetyltransferase [Ruminococcaceae bacterium]|nr:GNAT family N-acetyltransferase [Oscillospiraceae bacterium]